MPGIDGQIDQTEWVETLRGVDQSKMLHSFVLGLFESLSLVILQQLFFCVCVCLWMKVRARVSVHVCYNTLWQTDLLAMRTVHLHNNFQITERKTLFAYSRVYFFCHFGRRFVYYSTLLHYVLLFQILIIAVSARSDQKEERKKRKKEKRSDKCGSEQSQNLFATKMRFMFHHSVRMRLCLPVCLFNLFH